MCPSTFPGLSSTYVVRLSTLRGAAAHVRDGVLHRVSTTGSHERAFGSGLVRQRAADHGNLGVAGAQAHLQRWARPGGLTRPRPLCCPPDVAPENVRQAAGTRGAVPDPEWRHSHARSCVGRGRLEDRAGLIARPVTLAGVIWRTMRRRAARAPGCAAAVTRPSRPRARAPARRRRTSARAPAGNSPTNASIAASSSLRPRTCAAPMARRMGTRRPPAGRPPARG